MSTRFGAALIVCLLAAWLAPIGASAAPGDFDSTFGSGFGKVLTPMGSADDQASSVAIQPDGKLVVGGTQIWINNFELEAPIIKAAGISAVVFFDAGNAFGDPWGNGGINPLDLRLGYGAGIRWFSPMGPLRFEWGFPFAPIKPYEDSVQFQFTVGNAF